MSRGICTPEDRLDMQIFSQRASANWIEVTKKMADNLNYFSDNEESKWLANIDPRLFDKSNEGKQLDDSEISSFSWVEFSRQSRSATHTSVTHCA